MNRQAGKTQSLALEKIIHNLTTYDSLGSQTRQEEAPEEVAALIKDIQMRGQIAPISVLEWCKYNPVPAPSGAEEGETLYVPNNGHTRLAAMLQLVETGNKDIGPPAEWHRGKIRAIVYPSLTDEATNSLLSRGEEPTDDNIKNEVLKLQTSLLQDQNSLNMGVQWGELSVALNTKHLVDLRRQQVQAVLGEGNEVDEGDLIKDFAKDMGSSVDEVREALRLVNPSITHPELQEAFKEGLINISTVRALRLVNVSSKTDEEGLITNQAAIDKAAEVREALLLDMIAGKYTVSQLRKKIKKMNEEADGALKEKSRKTQSKVEKITGLDEATALAWVNDLDSEVVNLDDAELHFVAGAIAAIKIAIDPAASNDVLQQIIDGASAFVEEVEEDEEEAGEGQA